MIIQQDRVQPLQTMNETVSVNTELRFRTVAALSITTLKLSVELALELIIASILDRRTLLTPSLLLIETKIHLPYISKRSRWKTQSLLPRVKLQP